MPDAQPAAPAAPAAPPVHTDPSLMGAPSAATAEDRAAAMRAIQALDDQQGTTGEPVKEPAPEPPPPPPAEEPKPAQEEPPVEPEAEEPAVAKERFGASFKALARAARADARRKQELKAQEAKIREYDELQKLKTENPREFQKRIGIPYEEHTKLVLSEDNKIAELQQGYSALEQRLAKMQQDQIAREEQHRVELAQVQRQNYIKTVHDVAKQKGFDVVATQEAGDTVLALQELTYKNTKRIMPIEQAIAQVEEYLEGEALKVARLDKIQKKLAAKPTEEAKPQTPPTVATPAAQRQPTRQISKTLSNSQQGSVTRTLGRPQTDDEALAEAAKLIKFMPDY